MANKTDRQLRKFSDECIQCGVCLNICALLNELELTPGEIAQAILADQVSEECLAAIQRCDMCGHCGEGCLVNLNPPDLIKAAREILVQRGRINPQDYDVMLVDREWNFFSIYRETWDVHFADLVREQYETLFFPGCTLAAYTPELARAAFAWLQGQGLQVGFSDLCCGNPLDSIGLAVEADRHLDRLRAQLASAGARQIITACPNCEARLKAAGIANVEVRSIYELMVAAGIQLNGSQKLTFHDSCPDRHNPANPSNVRRLLSGYPQVEMSSRGPETICCGSGGIVSMIDPELCSNRALARMAEYAESGADTCVTSCMACAHRLARASQPGQVRHCLEYVLNVQVDYAQVEQNAHAMWEGSRGEINLQRLAQTNIVEAKP